MIMTVLTTKQVSDMMINGSLLLGEGVYILPTNFSLDLGSKDVVIKGVKGKTIITSFNPGMSSTDFVVNKLDTTLPDNNPDGIYAVWKHPYMEYGGGFAHLPLNYKCGNKKVMYTQGTVLVKNKGVWSRHYTGNGFQSKGNFSVSNVSFVGCQFYLFSPFGLDETDKFEVNTCQFSNVARIVSSCLYGGVDHEPNWFNSLNYYPVDGKFRFGSMTITNSVFDTIHTSIVWGCPPSRVVDITYNNVYKCPTTIAFFNLYMKCYGNEEFFHNLVVNNIINNNFMDVVQTNSHTTSLIRTSGISTILNNGFANCTPQIILLYGGDSLIAGNTVTKPNSKYDVQSPVFLVKNIGEPVHTFKNNNVDAPECFFIALEGKASVVVDSLNDLKVKTLYSKNDSTPGDSQSFIAVHNKITSPSLTNVGSKTTNRFKQIKIVDNTLTNVFNFHTGATNIVTYEISKNQMVNCSTLTTIYQATEFICKSNT